MRTATLRSVLTTVLEVALVLAVPLTAVTSAATAKTATPSALNNNANTLKISPLRSDPTIAAGESGKVEVSVTNLTASPIVLKPIENDFIAGDEKGTPSIILDENSYAPTHSLKRFMVPIGNITVPAGGTQVATVTIAVPKTAQAGGYFGALRFTPASNGSQPVNLSASVASLILLTVPGPTVEQLTLTNFDIQQNGGTANSFRTPDNLNLLVRFQNKGNLQEAPFGQVDVQKGKKVVYSVNFNQTDPKDEVLPDSARRWTLPLKHLGKFGKYTISGTFGYGTKGQTINIQKTVWIIPTAYILIVGGGILALVVLIVAVWVFLRSYKRRILRSSRSRY